MRESLRFSVLSVKFLDMGQIYFYVNLLVPCSINCHGQLLICNIYCSFIWHSVINLGILYAFSFTQVLNPKKVMVMKD